MPFNLNNPITPVQKLWNYRNILRDDGLSCGDCMHRWFRLLLALSLCAAGGCSTQPTAPNGRRANYRDAKMVEPLNALRDDINARYGFRNGTPRINLGPCGRFARDFRERWNARFREQVTIAFIMSNTDPSNCFHVLVRLPDGRYYDGGNGVMTGTFLTARYSGGHIEEMKQFDFELLDKRSYGLGRTYPECPNYSDEFTQQCVEKRLSEVLTNQKAP
jgi:hypothetical protein